MTKAKTEQAEVDDELGDLEFEDVPGLEVVNTGQGVKVGMEFPPDTDPRVIEETMRQVAKLTADRAKAKSSMDESRAVYEREGHRRWRCKIDSQREGIDYFELIISHPKTDKPVKVQGQCGVVLEQGLTKFTLERLRDEHSIVMVDDKSVDRDASMGLTRKPTKFYHWRVETFEEIEKPEPVGTIGK